jgi:hypothetical protein
MGIWSAFLYTYNLDTTIDTSKLIPDAIVWINAKLEYSLFNNNDENESKKITSISNESGIMNFERLLSKFTDVAHIYGYLDDNAWNVLHNISSCLSQLTTIVFKCDGNVDFYAFRMDPTTKKATLLLVENEKDIECIHDPEEGTNTQMFIDEFLKKDSIRWIAYNDSDFKKKSDQFMLATVMKNPAILQEKGLLELIMTLNGY